MFRRAKPLSTPQSPTDKMNHKELKSSMESLLSTLKCPVCFNLVDKDMILCVNGHATCKSCLRNRTSCPSCRQAFSNLQLNTVFKQILEVVPHNCRFNGCSYVVKPGDDHETYCRYRIIKCEFSNCTWTGTINDLIGLHYEAYHHKKVLYQLPYSFKLFNDPNGTSVFKACGHYFWQKIRLEFPTTLVDHLYTSFSYIPIWMGKPTRDIYLRISFQSNGKEYDAGMKIEASGSCSASDYRFILSQSMLIKLRTKDYVEYHLLITEERDEAINFTSNSVEALPFKHRVCNVFLCLWVIYLFLYFFSRVDVLGYLDQFSSVLFTPNGPDT